MISLLLTMMAASDGGAIQTAAVTAAAPQVTTVAKGEAGANKIKCKSKPKLGTRLAQVKVCMTLAEWNATRTDQQQAQRDMTSGFAYSPNGR